MQTTLIDGLVNFKEGFARALIAIRGTASSGVDEGGGDAAAGRTPAPECRKRLTRKGGKTGGKRAQAESERASARHTGAGHIAAARPFRHH